MFAYERIRNMIKKLEHDSAMTTDEVISEIENERNLTVTEKEELTSLLVKVV